MKAKPRKIETIKTIAVLEKQYRKTKKRVWKKMAEELGKKRRNRTNVNLWKLDKMAKKFSGKTLVVPGKILGQGKIKEKVSVIALEYSESARRKLAKTGKAISFEDAVREKIKPEAMVIIK